MTFLKVLVQQVVEVVFGLVRAVVVSSLTVLLHFLAFLQFVDGPGFQARQKAFAVHVFVPHFRVLRSLALLQGLRPFVEAVDFVHGVHSLRVTVGVVYQVLLRHYTRLAVFSQLVTHGLRFGCQGVCGVV